MAKALGIEIAYLYTRLPRGSWSVPLRYPVLAVRTLSLLFKRKPNLVFVQNPPFLAVLIAWLYGVVCGAKFIVDSHSDAMLPHGFTAPPGWLKRFISRRAIVTLVTNQHFSHIIEGFGGKALIIRDIPALFNGNGSYSLGNKFSVVCVNTFSVDEPTDKVVEAAKKLPEVDFYITGKIPLHYPLAGAHPRNVHFTNFLEDADYYSLLHQAHAIMCLTTRDHTMQRGACEALSLGRPIITSDWPILRQYFNQGCVYVDNTETGIGQGVLEMENHYAAYEGGIKQLQFDQKQEWQEKVAALNSLIRENFSDRLSQR